MFKEDREERREKVAALRAENKSYGIIAKELGTTRSVVAGLVYRGGFRPAKGAKHKHLPWQNGYTTQARNP